MDTLTLPLAERWKNLREEKPDLRIRNCADELGVSEGELLATQCGTDAAIKLKPEFPEILKRTPELGRVMALTRNDSIVHERYGEYMGIETFHGVMAQAVGPDIDLRIFLKNWHFGFAVTDETKDGPRKSLQFFNQDGDAVHKIFLNTEDSNHPAYDSLVAEYRAEDQSSSLAVTPLPPSDPPKPDAEIDVDGFRDGWSKMTNTHDFFGLLKKFEVARTQALRLAGDEFAVPVSNQALRHVLNSASESGLEIMIFVGNPGCIQIHTGPVHRIVDFKEWINVLDPDFNLHAREADIAESWIVRKPTDDGIVTSLEIYDAAGENLALLFGKRKPGMAELEGWRDVVKSIPAAD